MSWSKKNRVVVPIDFSDPSREALDQALEFVDDASKVHVVHVAHEIVANEPGVVWGVVDEESRRGHVTDAFKKEFADKKYEGVQFQVRFGDPGNEITDYASEIDAELIVLPSHGRTGIKRLLIGSVAERVVRLAKCPVLVLRS